LSKCPLKTWHSRTPDSMLYSPNKNDMNETLLIHLGGLGDMCLSESVFSSLSLHFNKNLTAVGYTRFLNLFEGYFAGTEHIESRKWLYLFSSELPYTPWERIVFIGKDRQGNLRQRWQGISKEPLIFIDMYPDENTSMHVEDYQLMQLAEYGIQTHKKEVAWKKSKRVILYPEKGFQKTKWGPDNFIQLFHALKLEGIDVLILQTPELKVDAEHTVFLEELTDVRDFFQGGGGIFVSNDSGIAHLAGMCGLLTITIFSDFDSKIWHPRGYNIAITHGKDSIDVTLIKEKILKNLSAQSIS